MDCFTGLPQVLVSNEFVTLGQIVLIHTLSQQDWVDDIFLLIYSISKSFGSALSLLEFTFFLLLDIIVLLIVNLSLEFFNKIQVILESTFSCV